MKNYLMAIDAGTGSVRAVLFDLKGNQIGCSQHEWTHNEDPRFPVKIHTSRKTRIFIVLPA